MDNSKNSIVFFAHAGGSALSYLSLLAPLSDSANLCPADLPGHGARMGEPLLHTAHEMAEDAASTIADVSAPAIVFGHSLGGMIAYSALKLMAERGLAMPRRLILSCCHTPGHFRIPRDSYLRPEDEFIKIVARHGAHFEQLLGSEEARRLFIPILRADFEAILTNPTKAITALPIPVTLIAATADDYTYAEQTAWRRSSSVSFRIVRVPGGHFYFFDDSTVLCTVLRSYI